MCFDSLFTSRPLFLHALFSPDESVHFNREILRLDGLRLVNSPSQVFADADVFDRSASSATPSREKVQVLAQEIEHEN